MLRANEVLIHDGTPIEHPILQGPRGLVPRNYDTHPAGCYATETAGINVPLIPRDQWSARIADMLAAHSALSDIRLSGNGGGVIPSLDQNSGRNDGRWGYCWAHSSTHSDMMVRAVNNLPYVPLSAFAVAATIKSGANEGGWGAQSMDFIIARGTPSQKFWPQNNVNLANGTAECWANAATHKVTEGFMDLGSPQYSRNLTFDQVGTLLLSRVPVVADENWWEHSICFLDLVDGSTQVDCTRTESGKLATPDEVDLMWGLTNEVTGGYGVRILNSWSDSWSDRGMGLLTGSKAVPDGAVAPRVAIASEA